MDWYHYFLCRIEQFNNGERRERLVIRKPLFIMLGLVLLTIAIVLFFPKY
jgi:hypothetical protein